MSSVRRPFIAGNWKMHNGPTSARRFFERFLEQYGAHDDRTIVFFPADIALAASQDAAKEREDVSFGVQNIYWEEKGAFTGEISASMAAEAGASFVLIGHSERRQLFGETEEETGRKLAAVLQSGLVPVLCVGETLEEREAGRAAEVVARQIEVAFAKLSPSEAGRALIAYEPIWAIGTGRTAAPSDAEEMHGHIRSWMAGRFDADLAARLLILYGGSVKAENAEALLGTADVDGVLVGGASLDPDAFARICLAGA